ncbi:MAG: LysR family transcriptional regulator [Acinetobacter sp.]
MELRQLDYFITTARLKNLTRAAEYHFVSQPNITIAIKKLEDELGTKLFHRKRNGFLLTVEGELFLKRVQPIINALQDAVSELNDLKLAHKNEIILGIPPMISSFIFAQIIKNFRASYPNIHISVVEEGSLGLQQRLDAGDLDLAIIIIDKAPKSLSLDPLMRRQHELCIPIHHPLANKSIIDWTDLDGQPLILMKDDSFHRREILKQCEKNGIKPDIFISSNQIQSNLEMVANGDGLSFMLNAVAVDTKKIVVRPMAEPLHVTIGLAWKKEKYRSAATHSFMHFVKNFCKTHFTDLA